MSIEEMSREQLVERIAALEQELTTRWHEEEGFALIYDALDSTLNGVAITDLQGVIRYANPSFLYMFEYRDRAEVTGNYAMDIFVANRISEFSDLERIIESGGENSQEFYVYRNDGSIFQVEVLTSTIKDKHESVIGRMLSFNDITERKKVEWENKRLSRMILTSQEMERQRLSKDLHDGVGQTILAAKLNFVAFQKDMKKHRDRFQVGLQFIDTASQELREIYNDLYPSILSDMGLESTVRWYSKNSLELNRIKTAIDIDLEEQLLHNIEVDIYRIIKEIFANIIKHSSATEVSIRLYEESDDVILQIEDNGKGFDPEEAGSQRRGFGLSNIKQRVNSHGGMFAVKSSPGSGTSIKISIRNSGIEE